MPINAHPEYIAAEKEYIVAKSLGEKIEKLRKMISVAPSHKGAENLRAQLRGRLKRFQEKLEKGRKSGKHSSKLGIKKEDMQAIIVGFTNSGKSMLLSKLTNAKPRISDIKFTTTSPIVGMMDYFGTSIQLIENPAIESEYYDKGLSNTADTLIIVVRELNEIEKIKKLLEKSKAKQIIVFNNFYPEKDARKVSATLSSKRYNFVIISNDKTGWYDELKDKIFQSFDKIRIYTKEPGKAPSKNPLILEPKANVEEVAEKILKGLAKKVKETRIWGPSSKFPSQKVGLKHELKDKDIIEFKTK